MRHPADAKRGSGLDGVAACLRGTPPAAADWDAIILEANAHLIAPALHHALTTSPDSASVPEDVRAYLQLLHDLNHERNTRLKAQATEAVIAFNEVGIEPVLLKGSTILFEAADHRLGLRMLSDLDLMVRPEQLSAAMQALTGLGYQAVLDVGEHAYAKLYRPEDVGTIDLHHRPPGPAQFYQGSHGKSGDVIATGDGRARIPSVTERMVHIIVHDMLNDRHLLHGSVDMRRLLDLRDLVGTGKADWDALQARFPRGAPLWALQVVLVNLRDLLDVEIPTPTKSNLLPQLLYRRQLLLMRYPWLRRIEPAWMLFRLKRRIRRGMRRAR